MRPLIQIDGSLGEGGGQIVRSSLSLAMVSGRGVRITNIRAKRRKPGLLRQHLTALNAAVEVCGAEVTGNVLGSQEVTFIPGAPCAGDYTFHIGSAGSATLVFQTVLPALLVAEGRSRVKIEGGTHNPMAPPVSFLEQAFIPLLNRMGADVSVALDRYGFYPVGGGSFSAEINGGCVLKTIELLACGTERTTRAEALLSQVPESVGERELAGLSRKLDLETAVVRDVSDQSPGPGNVLMVSVEDEVLTEVFTAFGERGVSAERVAGKLAGVVKAYRAAAVPVGPYLADQLLIPMLLAGGGMFRTVAPTLHTRTNIDVIKRFFDVEVRLEQEERDFWCLTMRGARP
jgi:RNA 3'-terminal phosphate cyclase (ATP)